MKIIFLMMNFVFLSQFVDAKANYPFIAEMNGRIMSVTKDGTNLTLTKGMTLKDRATIVTSLKSQLRIEVDAKTTLILLEDSRLDIPSIGQEGEVSFVLLESGNLRIIAQGPTERIYATPLTRDVYPGADFLLNYDLSKARTTLLCFKGGLTFKGQEHEEEAYVGYGERVSFQGHIEGGQLAFDVLLKGRKAARGSLTSVEKLSDTDLQTIEKASWVKAPEAPKKVVAKPRKPDEICDDPFGKLNQCVWKCVNNPAKAKNCQVGVGKTKCIRYRCAGDGQWADSYDVPKSQNKCSLSPQVGPCDY